MPAPTMVCSSSMNRMIRPSEDWISLSTAFRRSSNSPRYLASGDQGAHVQGEEGLVLEALGHVLLDDALGQALGDGGLAHAGLADEHGVVLGAPGQDADHPADLVVAADHRVELALLGLLHQVAAVLLEGLVGLLGVGRGHPLGAAHVREHGQDLVLGQAELLVHLAQRRGRRLLQQGEEQVLHADVVVLHGLGHVRGPDQGFVHLLGDGDLPRLAPGPETRGRRPSSSSRARS